MKNKVDIGVHSMKDVPAEEVHEDLEIICWFKREFHRDALYYQIQVISFLIYPLDQLLEQAQLEGALKF